MEESVPLSIVITVVSGSASLRRNLGVLCRQARHSEAEIIVPFDRESEEVTNLASSFPEVRFVRVDESFSSPSPIHETDIAHRLYDRRRAAGLEQARGRIIALTEDQAIPADDWCEQILAAHAERPDLMVIGGAIENEVDEAINWARYFCDFGRYGRPFASGFRDYVSDVNVSYKREAIFSVRELWKESYHETTVHWALVRKGLKLFLDDRIVVFQHRPHCTLPHALKERVQWGRVFAETRAREVSQLRSYLYAFGTIILPFILFGRAAKHILRQSQPNSVTLWVTPLVLALSVGWSVGELFGYVTGKAAGSTEPVKQLETSVPVKL